MIKRSFALKVAFGVLASLAFATSSEASSYLISVQESFSVVNNNHLNTIESVTLGFTGLNGISNVASSATGITTAFQFVTPTPSSNVGAGTVTSSYSPSVTYLNGDMTFNTIANTNDVTLLQAQIQLTGIPTVLLSEPNGTYTISTGTVHFTVLGPASVPEPTSMALLGIGMTGFLAFRRLFKRNAVA
jgi:hypothetical protein